MIDEDGNKTLEFKNGKGQTLMVRKEDGSSTYYVYNEYDQLAFVLPPMASMRGILFPIPQNMMNCAISTATTGEAGW
ncbi:hypothetical protein EGY05_08040 [Chryseobacterium arthrosphaerae]|nr:hypothetical protein EGY05_08040 [Chryseobacterium arthrosphaerae]